MFFVLDLQDFLVVKLHFLWDTTRRGLESDTDIIIVIVIGSQVKRLPKRGF